MTNKHKVKEKRNNKKFIANKKFKHPILIAGDSNGDYAMLKDFDGLQMGIIFNLLRDPSKGIASCYHRLQIHMIARMLNTLHKV